MKLVALAAVLAVVAAACGSGAAAPTPTPIRTASPLTRPATPTPLCPAAPSQPSTKATITLEKGGAIVIQLKPDKAPKTVSNFAFRANKGLYDGLTFHRVEANFVIQGGDPAGNGSNEPASAPGTLVERTRQYLRFSPNKPEGQRSNYLAERT